MPSPSPSPSSVAILTLHPSSGLPMLLTAISGVTTTAVWQMVASVTP